VNKEKLAQKYLTPFWAGKIKNLIAYPRYRMQLRKCREGFRQHGLRYDQKILFVAGLPKSGTTWLEKMLYSLPGFHEVMIPEAVYYEQAHTGSHDFDFPKNTFSRLKNALVVLKLHVHGSANNAGILEQAELNYVVIFRDLRDVAVSYFFYVKNTPWHPEYARYKDVSSCTEGLYLFAENILPAYHRWVESWSAVSSARCLIVKYEEMRADSLNVFSKILKHYKIQLPADEVQQILDRNSFKALSKGRSEGQGDAGSFFRKGISGDWKNHFNEELKAIYKKEIGDFLIKYEYEKDLNW
jgi:hypothetical protein